MPLLEHLEPRRPGPSHDARDALRPYWLQDGVVHYRAFPLKGADPASFEFWSGGFARDARHAYMTSSRLSQAEAASFRALNFCFARDATRIWTLGGELDGVDAASFEVLDDGACSLPTGSQVPKGYGRDRARVWYYGFQGRPKALGDAQAASCVSLNDGHFAHDGRRVWCDGRPLARARAASWRVLGGYYSTDGERVFYYDRLIPDAEAATFQVVPARAGIQLARDARRRWWNDVLVDEVQFERKARGS